MINKVDMASPSEKPSTILNLGYALVVIILVIATEYFFRHVVLFWLPIIGALRVNDMLVLLIGYGALLAGFGWALKINWRLEIAGIWQALKEMATQSHYLIWILCMMACLFVLPFLDRIVWARLSIPMLLSPYRNPAVWLPGADAFLYPIAVILVNGVFVPMAEEFLWRGQAQNRLLRVLPSGVAIGVTAVLFSFKHVLVDASFGRFMTLIAFGVICGMLTRQKDWHYSAALHILINTISTLTGLLFGII